jgi:recombination protein RecA
VGNAVGSLSGVQRQIIVGTVLGDGSMRRSRTNALLEINHSVKQREYVDWKYDNLAAFVLTPPKERPGNGGRVAYRFVTRSDPELTSIYRVFYENGVKRVPSELELTPLTMAVWYMDDGSKSRRAVYLNTQQFDLQSQERFLGLMSEQWGISGSLHKDKQYQRIWVRVESVTKFVGLIDPFVLPQFKYKLPQVTP